MISWIRGSQEIGPDPPSQRHPSDAATDPPGGESRTIVIRVGGVKVGWDQRLIFVDDRAVIMVLSRLLSSTTRNALLRHESLADLRDDIGRSRLPTDLNWSFAASCLIDAAGAFFADLPTVAIRSIEQPVRVEGVVEMVSPAYRRSQRASANEPSNEDLILKAKLDTGQTANLRLAGARSYGWTTKDLAGQRILAIGLLRRPQVRQVVAAAVAQLEPVKDLSDSVHPSMFSTPPDH